MPIDYYERSCSIDCIDALLRVSDAFNSSISKQSIFDSIRTVVVLPIPGGPLISSALALGSLTGFSFFLVGITAFLPSLPD